MAFFATSCTVTIDFKLADIRLESSEVIMKLEKNLSQDFNKFISFFVKRWFRINVNISHIFTPTRKYIRMPKIIDIG